MQELKTEQTIEKLKDMIIDFGDGLLEFETKDVCVLLNQLELQENYNDMLVRELEDLKAENEKMKVGLFQRMEGSFNWAIKEMKKGKMVVRDGTFGGLKYRLSTDEQNRLQWDFHRKETEVKWESANFFVSDIMATDWVIYNWR